MSFEAERSRRKAIFEDSMRLCREHALLRESLIASYQNQVLYPQGYFLEKPALGYSKGKDAEIVVSGKRTFEAAEAYAKSGKKVAVLNFASFTSPGGGVVNGARAQEECLCRVSTLYPCLSDQKFLDAYYIKHVSKIKIGKMDGCYNDDSIYTPGVVVFKSDEEWPELLPEEAWYQVDVITSAAPNLHHIEPGKLDEKKLYEIHYHRVCHILEIAKEQKEDVVILGAFGCGAFLNPPGIVAEAMKAATSAYIRNFETIEFAVYTSSRDLQNYSVFREVFEGEQ